MTVQVDFWYLVGLLLGFLSVCGTGMGLLWRQTLSHFDSRFAAIEQARTAGEAKLAERMVALENVNRDETLSWQRVEREFLKFQADLPMKYVMRDDYIRGQTVIEAKLDSLATRMENAQLRAIVGGGAST